MKLKSIILAVICTLCTLPIMAQEDESVTNETIITLLEEGFNSEEIISYVDNASTREVKMGINEMRALKAAGADSELISYLQKIAKTDFGKEGVYWWNTGDKPKKLYRCSFEKSKKGMSGSVLGVVGGTAGAILGGSTASKVAAGAAGAIVATSAADFQKLVVQGGTAKIVLSGENASNPVFRFYFPKTENNSFEQQAESWYFAMMSEVQSPNEFQCIKMKTDKKKTKRQFPDGAKYTVAGFSSSDSGTKDIVDFEISEINNNTFEVSFPNGLEPGEYIFFYKDGLNNQYFQQHPFGFDFSVQ